MLFKFEKLIFLALVFSIPFQKRSFLFGPQEFSEWNSAFFYFTDALILLLFVFWLVNRSYKTYRTNRTYTALLGLFLLFAFISIFQAELINVGVYRFLKLAEFIFLFFYTVSYVGSRTSHIKQVLWVFIASGVFQSLIAIAQFAKQSSLGLQIFHESTLDIGMKGVAQIVSGGVYMIRAYGTFPNPNVLAGFLGICLFFAFYLFLNRDKYFLKKILIPISIFILSFGFLLTFSRGVIIFFLFTSALFFLGVFTLKKLSRYRKSAAVLLTMLIAYSLLLTALVWPEISARFLESSASEPAVTERLFFNRVGIETATRDYSKLFFGVGIGNFVHYYMGSIPGLKPHLYQPVHNIFILIASEIGILGFAAFIIFLSRSVGRSVKIFFASGVKNLLSVYLIFNIVLLILGISMYDHYFWTLQQGGLMFWIILGLFAASQSNSLAVSPPNPLVGKVNRKV